MKIGAGMTDNSLFRLLGDDQIWILLPSINLSKSFSRMKLTLYPYMQIKSFVEKVNEENSVVV